MLPQKYITTIRYSIYSNAWLDFFYLKFGAQTWEVSLKYAYEMLNRSALNRIALNQTMQSQTKPYIAQT